MGSEHEKGLHKGPTRKKKPAEKHRELILKWQKQGQLATLLTLYETEKANSQRQQPTSPAMDAAFTTV